MDQHIRFTTVERAVERAAKKHGFNGDPFGRIDYRTGSENQEWGAIVLFDAIPPHVRRLDPEYAYRLCRNAVMEIADRGEEPEQINFSRRHRRQGVARGD